jgi:hypothetical protein
MYVALEREGLWRDGDPQPSEYVIPLGETPTLEMN